MIQLIYQSLLSIGGMYDSSCIKTNLKNQRKEERKERRTIETKKICTNKYYCTVLVKLYVGRVQKSINELPCSYGVIYIVIILPPRWCAASYIVVRLPSYSQKTKGRNVITPPRQDHFMYSTRILRTYVRIHTCIWQGKGSSYRQRLFCVC